MREGGEEMASVQHESPVQIHPDELVNSVVDEDATLAVRRLFTIEGRDPYDEVEWEIRDAHIPGKNGPAFEQKNVEFPKFWSQTATNIVAQKYFRGRMSSPERETSVKDMIGRVVGTIGTWGRDGGYFQNEDEASTFEARAEGDPRQPARRVQLAGLVQRRLRREAAVLRLLHPVDRRLDGRDPRLDPPRRRHLPGRLGLGRQPLAPPLVEGAAVEGRLRLRAGVVHARRRRVGRDDQVGRQDAPRGEDGRPRRRPSGHPGVHLVQVARGGEGARPRGGGLRHVARLAGLGVDPVSERQQLGARLRLVHGGGRGRRRLEPHRAHRRHGRRHAEGQEAAARDRRSGVALRRPGRAVRHDDQLVAHAAEHRAHQRVEPVLRVHVDRRLGVQPRVAEPHEVPPRGRRARRRGVRARVRRRVPRTGDRGRQLVVPDAGDRAEREGVPPARPRLREPRRAADGTRARVRLRRGSRLRSGDHGAHDGARLSQVGGDRRPHGRLRGLPPERSRDAERHLEAPRGRRQHRRHQHRAGRPAQRRAQGLGRRVRPRRGARLPQRAGDGARADRDDQLHDGLRHDRCRAGLLARQVEEAGRRRRDHDRQQDGVGRPREARLRAGRGCRDRRLHRRTQHRRRCALREERALPGVRLRRRRARDPLHGSREDDGRDPAVHLRRDLEDGQPAGDGDDRRCGRPLSRGVEARRQGDRDLPRQLQGRAAAVGQGRQEPAGHRTGRRDCRPEAAPPAGGSHRSRPQVPRRRVRGVHPRRSARRRDARRHLRRHREGRHHDGRPDELADDRGVDGPAVRRAARGLRVEALASALRAVGSHERRGHPPGEVDRRLHLPLVREEVPRRRPAGGGRHPVDRGAAADGGPDRERRVRTRRSSGSRSDRAVQPARGCDRVQPLRRAHGSRRHLLHVP